jgi:DNA-binding transcriptional ArsR family regulator
MLSFVPTVLDMYRTVKRHLHWTLQNLVAFADTAGGCWPSIRKLVAVTGTPRSTLSRHLIELAEAGIIQRHRKPGGVYSYTIDPKFLPKNRRVSHRREEGVPPGRTEEKVGKNKAARGRASFAKPGKSFSEMPDDRAKWGRRLRSWSRSRFWIPLWGPKPTEPGCFVPRELLDDHQRGQDARPKGAT